jgi:hypothetical protein
MVEAMGGGPGTSWQQGRPEGGEENKRKCKVKIFMEAKTDPKWIILKYGRQYSLGEV